MKAEKISITTNETAIAQSPRSPRAPVQNSVASGSPALPAAACPRLNLGSTFNYLQPADHSFAPSFLCPHRSRFTFHASPPTANGHPYLPDGSLDNGGSKFLRRTGSFCFLTLIPTHDFNGCTGPLLKMSNKIAAPYGCTAAKGDLLPITLLHPASTPSKGYEIPGAPVALCYGILRFISVNNAQLRISENAAPITQYDEIPPALFRRRRAHLTFSRSHALTFSRSHHRVLSRNGRRVLSGISRNFPAPKPVESRYFALCKGMSRNKTQHVLRREISRNPRKEVSSPIQKRCYRFRLVQFATS
jgi:hypothetical protein